MATLREKGVGELPEPIQLASGAWSSHFVDGKHALAAWSDLRTAGQAISDTLTEAGCVFDAVGGPALGADALAVAIAAVTDTQWFVVRDQPKQRGTRRLIEGARLGTGNVAVLVDDVVTTGGSMLRAYQAVTGTGARVAAVAALVDRGNAARERFEKMGVPYFPMATYKEMRIEPVA